MTRSRRRSPSWPTPDSAGKRVSRTVSAASETHGGRAPDRRVAGPVREAAPAPLHIGSAAESPRRSPFGRRSLYCGGRTMNLDERAINVFTDGSSLPAPRRGGTGICFVTAGDDGREVIETIQPQGHR